MSTVLLFGGFVQVLSAAASLKQCGHKVLVAAEKDAVAKKAKCFISERKKTLELLGASRTGASRPTVFLAAKIQRKFNFAILLKKLFKKTSPSSYNTPRIPPRNHDGGAFPLKALGAS